MFEEKKKEKKGKSGLVKSRAKICLKILAPDS